MYIIKCCICYIIGGEWKAVQPKLWTYIKKLSFHFWLRMRDPNLRESVCDVCAARTLNVAAAVICEWSSQRKLRSLVCRLFCFLYTCIKYKTSHYNKVGIKRVPYFQKCLVIAEISACSRVFQRAITLCVCVYISQRSRTKSNCSN